MIRQNRIDIVRKIIRIAGLPIGKDTNGYFTRTQLIELLLRIESCTCKGKEDAEEKNSRQGEQEE